MTGIRFMTTEVTCLAGQAATAFVPEPLPEPLPEPRATQAGTPLPELLPEPLGTQADPPLPEPLPAPVPEPVPEPWQVLPLPEPLPWPLAWRVPVPLPAPLSRQTLAPLPDPLLLPLLIFFLLWFSQNRFLSGDLACCHLWKSAPYALVAMNFFYRRQRGVIRNARYWQTLLGLKGRDGPLGGGIEIFVNRASIKSKIGQSGLEAAHCGKGIEVAQLQNYDVLFGPGRHRVAILRRKLWNNELA
jgi:hypothetical protein